MDKNWAPSDQDKHEWRQAIYEGLGMLERGTLLQVVQAVLLALILWRIW